MNKASKVHGIPGETLRRIYKKNSNIREHGHETVLTKKEDAIAEWVKENGRRGFEKSADEVCEAVKPSLRH